MKSTDTDRPIKFAGEVCWDALTRPLKKPADITLGERLSPFFVE